MGLFTGKKGLILGVFNEKSIAWAIAKRVMQEGGVCGYTHLPDQPDDARQKNRSRVARLIEPYEQAKFLMPMDVARDEDIQAMAERAGSEFGRVDFLLHAIAHAPLADLKNETIRTSREGFKSAMDISCYSFLAVSNAVRELLNPGASLLTMTYFGGEKAVPGYNVMGICKAALDCTVKYLAYDVGLQGARVNAISAGPVRTLSGRGAGVEEMIELYAAVTPLQRNITEEELGNTGAFLLSEMSSGITGEILHLDCGYNIMGSPGRAAEKLKQGSEEGSAVDA